VRSLTPDGAGRVLEIAEGDATDFVILGQPGRLTSGQRFTTDFAWTWARLAPDGRLKELILVGGGTRFEYAGREVLASPRPLKYAAARAADGELRFEAEEEGGAERAAGGAESIIDGEAFGLRDKLSKDGRGAVAADAAGRSGRPPQSRQAR
jgi:hypothetical protein